jgi:hypothetical protein
MGYKKAVLKAFRAEETPSTIVRHHEEEDVGLLVELWHRVRESLKADIKYIKPRGKLAFLHTGMLDADRKLKEKTIVKDVKKTIKEKKRVLRKSRRRDSQLIIQQLEREIAGLERKVRPGGKDSITHYP